MSREGSDDEDWGAEIPRADLNQSGSDEDTVAGSDAGKPVEARSTSAAAEGWISDEGEDALGGGNSRDEEEEEGRRTTADPRPMVASDATSSLARDLYTLEQRLARAEAVEELRADNAMLREKLRVAEARIAERDERIRQMHSAQLEILQAMAVLKKHHRAFQQGVLDIVEALPPQRAAAELQSMVSGLVAQQKSLEAAAEQRYMQNDAECLASTDHPIVKLVRLTRNVNPLEASFALVRYFCRLEEGAVGPGMPVMAVLLDKALRFWEVTAEFPLYPLYSFIVTHCRSRVQRTGESTPQLLHLLSNLCALFFINRSDFDASESTDIVLLRNLPSILLGLNDQTEGDMGGSFASGAASARVGGPGTAKMIVKTRRAFWVELRKLVVLAYAFVTRNEGELVEGCIRSTLEHIRREAAPGDLKYDMFDRCSQGMTAMLGNFGALLDHMATADSPRAVVIQIFGQLCSLINGHCCNALMLRRSYATMHAAAAFRADLRHLEAWLQQHLPADAVPWLQGKLKPITEMINVLFMNKSLLRRPEIRQELCSSLTTAQLCQILSTYEPQRGEEPVSLALLQSLMPQQLPQPGSSNRSHQADVGAVLVDVTLLDALDLSVVRPDWVLKVTLERFKDAPMPDDLFEQFILFRERKSKEQQAAAKVPSQLT
jgi:hypothetical protein